MDKLTSRDIRARHQLHVFPRLASSARFPRLAPVQFASCVHVSSRWAPVTVSRAWHQCSSPVKCMFPLAGHPLQFPALDTSAVRHLHPCFLSLGTRYSFPRLTPGSSLVACFLALVTSWDYSVSGLI